MRAKAPLTMGIVFVAAAMSACAQIVGLGDWGSSASATGGATSTTGSLGGGGATTSTISTTSAMTSASGSSTSATTSSVSTTSASSSSKAATTATTGSGPTCNGVCLQGAGAGWSGPVTIVQGPCTAGTSQDTTVDTTGVIYQPDATPCASCVCTSPSTGACTYGLNVYSGGNCMAGFSAELFPTDDSCVAFGTGAPAMSVQVMVMSSSVQSCDVAGSCPNTPTARTVCDVDPTGSCPVTSDHCVPASTPICVWSKTNHGCAAPYNGNSYAFYDSVTPASCDCGTRTPSCAVQKVLFNLGGGCSTQGTPGTTNGCFDIPSATGAEIVPQSPGVCPASPTPKGGSLGTLITVCCTQ